MELPTAQRMYLAYEANEWLASHERDVSQAQLERIDSVVDAARDELWGPAGVLLGLLLAGASSALAVLTFHFLATAFRIGVTQGPSEVDYLAASMCPLFALFGLGMLQLSWQHNKARGFVGELAHKLTPLSRSEADCATALALVSLVPAAAAYYAAVQAQGGQLRQLHLSVLQALARDHEKSTGKSTTRQMLQALRRNGQQA